MQLQPGLPSQKKPQTKSDYIQHFYDTPVLILDITSGYHQHLEVW